MRDAFMQHTGAGCKTHCSLHLHLYLPSSPFVPNISRSQLKQDTATDATFYTCCSCLTLLAVQSRSLQHLPSLHVGDQEHCSCAGLSDRGGLDAELTVGAAWYTSGMSALCCEGCRQRRRSTSTSLLMLSGPTTLQW